MKKTFITVALALFCLAANAQVKVPQSSPKSTVTQTVGLTEVTLEYNRPSVKGRTVFGDLVPFAKLWRTGANQNSMVTFSEDVTIGGKTVKKGKYAIFATPKADSWEVFFYTDTQNWGIPAQWDETKVAAKTTVKSIALNRNVETFTIDVNNLDNNGGSLDISWEKTMVSVPFAVPTHATAMASIEKALNGPTKEDYYAAGTYLFQSNEDLKKSLEYVNKAISMNDKAPFWQLRQKSLIQAKLGDKKGAIETAKASLAAAEAAGNADYVKMNKDNIAEWSKK